MPATEYQFLEGTARVANTPPPPPMERTARVTLRSRLGVAQNTYEFRRMGLDGDSGGDQDYSKRMVRACATAGMVPVCDHPSYCRNDASSLFIGNSYSLTSGYYRRNSVNSYPKHFEGAQNLWQGSCGYSGGAKKGYAMCNVGGNQNSDRQPEWRTPDTSGRPGFVCGKVLGPLRTYLAPRSKNKFAGGQFEFKKMRLAAAEGDFGSQMISECKKAGMKPVCDSINSDGGRCLYLGNDKKTYLAYRSHRDAWSSYWPAGWQEIRQNWQNLCNYAGSSGKGDASCNYPSSIADHSNKYAKRSPKQYNGAFMCGRLVAKVGQAINASLSGFPYTFLLVKPAKAKYSGAYADLMLSECKKVGMKPVCNAAGECADDKHGALYIGHNGNIGYPANRRGMDEDFPDGWQGVQALWAAGACTYTAKARGNYAYCNWGTNSYGWRTTSQVRLIPHRTMQDAGGG